MQALKKPLSKDVRVKRRCEAIRKSFSKIDLSKIEKSHLKNKSNITVGTLSFPVCSGRTFRNNSDVISTIIRLRKPGLLLCAGWSIPSKKSLHLIQNATHHSRTVVVLETKKPKMVWRVAAGRLHQMGR